MEPIRARFRRLLVLIAVLAMTVGQLGQAVAALHAGPGMGVVAVIAAGPGADDTCGGCMTSDHHGVIDCQAVCGFPAVLAVAPEAPPTTAGLSGSAPDQRLPGWRGPPDPHPPKHLHPV